jgi:secreted trypsin-like serine protease
LARRVASSLLFVARMLRTISLSLLSWISISVGSTARASEEPGESNVVGGTRVPDGKWRDVVAVIGRESTCTGTLVAPDVVLTAAHCVVGEPYEIRSDTVDYTRGGDRIPVKWSRAYPDWENKYDVGVLVLEHVARGRPRKVAAACTTRERLVEGAKLHLVGFGLTTQSGEDTNTALREADVVVTDPTCTMDMGCHRVVAPHGEFMAGGSGVDACFGDSGGPVLVDTEEGPALVGVVSRGLALPGAPCGQGGIYTRADKVVSWIQSVAGTRVLRTADCDQDGPADGNRGSETGGCSTSGDAGLGLGIGLLLFGMRVSQRRHTRDHPI